MKKKLVLMVALVMGIIAVFGATPTKAEASVFTYHKASETEVTKNKFQTFLTLSAEVKVVNDSLYAPRRVSMTTSANNRFYFDCYAKLVRTVPVYDAKGAFTGKFEHYYSFFGFRV